MSEYQDNPVPLPVLELRNTDDGGKGPLRNGSKGEFVEQFQKMLNELGYDLGDYGVDGKFGYDTEKTVKQFQNEHKDWVGNQLRVDGLVGPRTADALNRAMVGVWYNEYKIHLPKMLTKDEDTLYISVLKDVLKKEVTLETKYVKKAIIILISERINLKIRLFDPFGNPIPDAPYRLAIGQKSFEGKADVNGWLEKQIQVMDIPEQCSIEWADEGQSGLYIYTLNLYLNFQGMSEEEALLRRLNNLGYIPDPSLIEISEIIKDFKIKFRLREESGIKDIIELHDKGFQNIQKEQQLLATLLESEPSLPSESEEGLA